VKGGTVQKDDERSELQAQAAVTREDRDGQLGETRGRPQAQLLGEPGTDEVPVEKLIERSRRERERSDNRDAAEDNIGRDYGRSRFQSPPIGPDEYRDESASDRRLIHRLERCGRTRPCFRSAPARRMA
jgi:hypothetical protein